MNQNLTIEIFLRLSPIKIIICYTYLEQIYLLQKTLLLKLLENKSAYSFSYEAVRLFGLKSKKTKLEKIEDIEILRVLENGIPVKIIDVKSDTVAVDTPEDLERVKKLCR